MLMSRYYELYEGLILAPQINNINLMEDKRLEETVNQLIIQKGMHQSNEIQRYNYIIVFQIVLADGI